MKKGQAKFLTGILAAVLVLTGCQASEGLETDDITISKYKEVEIEEVEEPEEVTEDDVTAYIDEELASNIAYEEVTDRAAEEGDTVNIDYVGTMDGEEFDGGSYEGYDLLLGSDTFIDGFEDSIIGHEAGDTFDWNGKFPDEYYEESLAGKDVTFTITVNSISLEKEQQLDDAFVQSVSDTAATVEEYEEDVKKYLEERAEMEHKLDIADAAWTVVMDNTEVKAYPEDEVQEVLDEINEEYEAYAEYYGVDMDTFVTTYMGFESREAYDEEAQQSAENSVKQTMAVDAIADKEKLTLDEDTYEEMVTEIAWYYYGESDGESLKESADQDALEQVAKQFMVKDWVGEHCIQVEGY